MLCEKICAKVLAALLGFCTALGCCAPSARGHATAAPPSSVMKSRRLMQPPSGAHDQANHIRNDSRRAISSGLTQPRWGGRGWRYSAPGAYCARLPRPQMPGTTLCEITPRPVHSCSDLDKTLAYATSNRIYNLSRGQSANRANKLVIS